MMIMMMMMMMMMMIMMTMKCNNCQGFSAFTVQKLFQSPERMGTGEGGKEYYTLNVWSRVSLVFPRVLMFSGTMSRETSGLKGKQN